MYAHGAAVTAAAHGRRGFTLVEALTSLVLCSIVIGVALSLVVRARQVRDAVQFHSREGVVVSRLLELLREDLMQSVPADAGAGLAPLRSGIDEDGAWILEFVTYSSFTSFETAPAGLRRVAYRYQSASALLGRREEPLGESLQEPAEWVALADNVSAVAVRFSDGAEWHDQWPPDESRRELPLAVGMVLEVETGGRSVSSSRTVWIPCGGDVP